MSFDLDALLLSRIQFAFTVSFHIVFPAMTIGLAAFLVVLEGAWLRTGEAVYFTLYKFWSKLFALAFGIGVVTGLVLSYEFGTNWSRFAAAAGNVIGPLMGYEVLTAFFLEAGFLGIMLVYSVLVLAFLLYTWRAVRLGPSEQLEVPLHDGRQRAAAAGAPAAPAVAPAA